MNNPKHKERLVQMCQQMSLRLSDELRAIIRTKLDELKSNSPNPKSVSEADAARALIAEAGKRIRCVNESRARS